MHGLNLFINQNMRTRSPLTGMVAALNADEPGVQGEGGAGCQAQESDGDGNDAL